MSRSKLQSRNRILRNATQKAVGFEPLESRQLMTGTVQATLINDINENNLVDPGETGIAGFTVFVDYNRDGIQQTTGSGAEPGAVTNSSGVATILNVTKGTWDVKQVLAPGWVVSSNFHEVDRVSVKDNQINNVQFLDNNPGAARIEGTVWSDLNGDGIRQAEDFGLEGWTVYLDQNTNRILDAGEVSTTTDVNGFYRFPGLTYPETYKVREITPAGWNPTLGFDGGNTVNINTGGAHITDFGNYSILNFGTIAGTVYNDVNTNGIHEFGESGLSGWTVFLDTNLNGIADAGEPVQITDGAGSYSFASIRVGNYRVVEELQAGWNISAGHTVSVDFNPLAGGVTSTVDYPNWTPTVGSISGKIWSDVNSNGAIDAGETGMSGVTVFIDADNDGVLDATEASQVSDANGLYTFASLSAGVYTIREINPVGTSPTAPGTGVQTITLPNGTNLTNINFGNHQRTDGEIHGMAYVDTNKNGTRDVGERGLSGITVYLDNNNNGSLDAGEPTSITSTDLFFTPAVDETGTYAFTHLPTGNYVVREVVPVDQAPTPAANRVNNVTLAIGEVRNGVNFGNWFRANEIHGVKFYDLNYNGVRDAGEPGMAGVTIYIDLNRNDILDAGEPTTITDVNGAYSFTGMTPGAYVVRAILPTGYDHSYPTTGGGILWPAGVSNPARGNVTPGSITQVLAEGQNYSTNVSLTLPNTGAITNKADVFLLFDDTGSFTGNSPIVRAAFPQIISTLQANLPGLDLGFGVGRFEEYANFAAEFSTGRPFILNHPIASQSTPGFAAAIQAALDRTAPGYGGDQPETDIEALFQMVTGAGFDGNNNGTTSDSGAAGAIGTQITPGASGDVPAFGTYTPGAGMLAAEGNIGGAGFRTGSLPIILLATDTGFAYQPKGETSITGVDGLTLPISQLTQTSRPTTPFSSGAGIQETITGLNALGALVIGLGTNAQTNFDPRQQLESIAKLTGAINRSAINIDNGTGSPILPGDPLYFQIATGFSASVANGVTEAIQNAVTSVAVDVTLRASDPRVHITSAPGVVSGLTAGQTANFNVTFTGDGRPHRFDLQFVRNGTNVVLGSIPVVLGTPVAGDGYEYEDLYEGEIHSVEDIGSHHHNSTGSVRGKLYEDRNGSGSYDASETPVSGTTVYADLNDNGSFDIGEPSATTDSSGDYVIYGLDVGSKSIREVLPAGRAFTTIAGGTSSQTIAGATTNAGVNFGTVPIVFNASAGTSYKVASNGAKTDVSTDGVLTFSVDSAVLPSLTFNGSPSNDVLEMHGSGLGDVFSNTGPGSVTHGSTTIHFSSTETIRMMDGTYNIGSDLGLVGVEVTGGASHAHFNHGQTLGSLNVGDGSIADVDESLAGDVVLAVNSLALNTSGKLNLNNNGLIIHDAASMAAVLAAISSGQGGLDGNGQAMWDGVGLVSGTARSKNVALGVDALTIAAMRNGDLDVLNGPGSSYTTWKGKAVGPNDVLVRYTYAGDATLDGTVTIDDYNMIDGAFLGLFPASGWASGDFDHNGTINIDDYNAIDTGFLYQTGSLGA